MLDVFAPTVGVLATPAVSAVVGIALMLAGFLIRQEGPGVAVSGVGITAVILSAFASPIAVGGLMLALLGTGLIAWAIVLTDWAGIIHAAKRFGCRLRGHDMSDQNLAVGFLGSPWATCCRCGIDRASLLRAAAAATPPIPRMIHDATTTTGVALNRRQSVAGRTVDVTDPQTIEHAGDVIW